MRKLLGILPISLVLLGACGGGGGGGSSSGGGGGTPQACTAVTVSAAQQLQNPVMLLPANYNNGVIVELPPVGPTGSAPPVNGVLVLGIGTVANNGLGGATQLDGDPNTGSVGATMTGTMVSMGFLDSGSNGNFFPNPSAPNNLTVCSNGQFYCSAANETATLQGKTNGNMAAADFSVADATTLFASTTFVAFSNLAGPNPTGPNSNTTLDLGLPFFYGRNIFTGFTNTAGSPPPYFAYGGTQTIATAGPPNVEPLIVDSGPAGLTSTGVIATNTPFVTISICEPGTSTCQTIDHIEVDTGSIGLRLISSVLTTVKLPLTTNNGQPYAECLQFADGTSWGSLATADIQLPTSGAKMSGVNVHLIGDPSVGSPPASCTGTPENTVPTFGANGILGVGPFPTDCSDGSCPPGPQGANYYSCPVTH